ncbi:SDR family oxidoreductase [Sphingomonas carotinifaciens]|uniref:SDR family oxidoreductase n=1 Tax=Sphingomonas carotinifaciens TaxID=1166323 RepID=UPI0022A65D2C
MSRDRDDLCFPSCRPRRSAGCMIWRTGIRVNVLSPGPTRTDLAAEVVGASDMEALGAMTPLGRLGDPAETASAAAFLASCDSSFMTGAEAFVDGGLAQV